MADLNKTLIAELIKSINDLRFGSIEITVHDSRVTQIECREKVRFEHHNTNNSPTAHHSGK